MNNLYTLGYFRKRLLGEGFTSKILINDFSEKDGRYWTISIDTELKIFCTCFREDDEISFEFWDGGNRIMNKFIVKTSSMNVIIHNLNTFRDKED
jgi:hypothetical protein